MTTNARGIAVLRDPRLNRSGAFSEGERETLGLTGLVPESIDTEKIQIERVTRRLEGMPSSFDQYRELRALQDLDETLYYRLLMSDPARFMPMVYTPAVGEACLKFGHLGGRPRGLYLSIKRKGHIREILRNWPERDVRFIVVTSGERILGLGDLGAHGMPIPIGKLALYTAGGGVPPQLTLPITIDCGTNNESLLKDQLYMGLRRHRPSVAELDELVEEFVTCVQQEFPNCCIQFEDWGRADAFRLLDRYRDRLCCFNDDIQGSAAVVLGGMLGALRITGGTLRDQTFLFLGAGSAAVGIANLLTDAMMLQGLSPEEAREHLWLFNRGGLIQSARKDLADYQRPYAQSHPPVAGFVAAIESIKPTTIIGVSTLAKAFDQSVIDAMARINRRPIVFALSNPTSHSECTALEAYRWSDGRAVFASGSPFPPVSYRGRMFVPGQCNNVYVFPAVGLAVYATGARRVTNEMFMAAAHAIAEQVTAADLEAGLIYPAPSNLLAVEVHTARRIAEVVFSRGLASVELPGDLGRFVESRVYKPHYPDLS
jgi:malate dehydrogenase (oxaloacetate-decarboxylating)(NADP+)